MENIFYEAFILKNGKTVWFNESIGELTYQRPGLLNDIRGGINANEMGLGKSLETIALILQNRKRYRNWSFLRMDGTTKNHHRKTILEEFAKGKTFALMMTIKTGGEGINAQAASSVILCEPDWNPHVEIQAVSRVHRIGQEEDCRCISINDERNSRGNHLQKSKKQGIP